VDVDDFMMIVTEYNDRFDRHHTLVGLDDDMLEQAAKLMHEAIELGVPYNDDAEFYEALGLDPPPTGAGVDI
jgi:hypothetical protein